jgi:2-polyprenyl-3-methyl-5-hydroxy-6-metoxy-1,4-benzoquinol methylase
MCVNQDYKNRIYEKYVTCNQNIDKESISEDNIRASIAYGYRLKGWISNQKDVNVLDVGCGSGRFLYYLKTHGYVNISGVDISQEQVAFARQITPNIFIADAVAYLESQTEAFDLIVGFDIVEHLSKDHVLRFLDACYKSLKVNGRLILQTPNGDSLWCNTVRYGDFTHETCFTPSSLKRLLLLCGFGEFEVRETGPFIHGLLSLIRFAVWKCIRFALSMLNLIEGCTHSEIYTRVFLIAARKN